MPEAVREYYATEKKESEGGVGDIKKQLETISPEEVGDIRKRIENFSPEIYKILGEEEIAYLALLQKKDDITFFHSLAVAETARLQLREFGRDLDNQNIPREAFLRAALFHDIGKLSLPDCVLKGTMTWNDFEDKFFTYKSTNPDFINQRLIERGIVSPSSGIETLSDKEIRDLQLNYRDFITLEQCFGDDDGKLDEIRSYGIDPRTTSFMDTLRLHEGMSKSIILQMDSIKDKSLVAELAGSHHHYSAEENEQFAEAKEVLRLSVETEEPLHIADVYTAIRQRRPYKGQHSHIEAMHIIVEEAKTGKFDAEIVKRWMKGAIINVEPADKSEETKLEQLKDFLQ